MSLKELGIDALNIEDGGQARFHLNSLLHGRKYRISVRTSLAALLFLLTSLWTLKQIFTPKFLAKQVIQPLQVPILYRDRYPSVPLNRTLGFQSIIALSLPNRWDRRDELTMMADASQIDITIEDAVRGLNLSHRGMPAHSPNLQEEELGCWRSHANAWKKMVQEGIETALILEDDVDWDVDVRYQLQRLQAPLGQLSASLRGGKRLESPSKNRPYPGDWELLWLGACIEDPWVIDPDAPQMDKYARHKPLILYEDETVTSSNLMSQRHRDVFRKYGIPLSDEPTSHGNISVMGTRLDAERPYRLVQKARFPICLSSYALTLQGARKLLYYTTRRVVHPVDISLADAAYQEIVSAYVAVPALMGQWKIHDGINSDVLGIHHGESMNLEVDPSVGRAENVGAGSMRRTLKEQIFSPSYPHPRVS